MAFSTRSNLYSAYNITIPVFDGPLDLLLSLIEHAELEITAISLAQVTEQYLSHIQTLNVPAEEISSFLLIAAKLIQIKSEVLLPRPPVHSSPEENLGDALARQLILYKRYKELSRWLNERESNNFRSFLRIVSMPPGEVRLDVSNISTLDIFMAAEDVLRENHTQFKIGTVISLPRVSIRDKLVWITNQFENSPTTYFSKLIKDETTRLEIVVTFLALLELIKRYQVFANQENLFDDIQIMKVKEFDEEIYAEIEFD